METEVKALSQKLTVRCLFCNTWNRIEAAKVTDGPKCGKCTKPILLERPFPLNDDRFYSNRAYFLIDREGRVRWSHVESNNSERRENEEIFAAMELLS